MAAPCHRVRLEQLPLVTYVARLEAPWSVDYMSPQVEALLGFTPEQCVAEPDFRLGHVAAEDREPFLETWTALRDTHDEVTVEYRLVARDGREIWVRDAATVVTVEGLVTIQGFITDITREKELELELARERAQSEREAIDALRRSEEQFRAVFDNAHDAMVIVDDEGCYVDVNPAACELYGLTRDALLALSVADIARAGAAPAQTWRDVLDQGTVAGAYTIVRRDGTRRETEFTATANVLPGRHLSILRDVTERTLERGLREAQKLESVGTLAAGIAHDFNNMLTAIGGYSQLLLARLSPGTIERNHAEEIERAADRAAKLTAQLLAFGRRQVLQPCAVDLNALVGDLSLLLSRIVGPEVVLVVEPEGELRTVSADPKQVEQVIWNLVVNAADAMPTGGRVALGTRNVDIEHDAASNGAPELELAGGRYVELSISDSGVGMDAETLEHVFEPFFTTKEVGLGDGLGLSTAYGIVKQSGGTIVAESIAGSGATFRIYLPAAE